MVAPITREYRTLTDDSGVPIGPGNPLSITSGGDADAAYDATSDANRVLNVDAAGAVLDTNAPAEVSAGRPVAAWTYAAAAGGILNSTTAVAIAAAAGGALKNYITDLQLSSEVLATATEFAIRNGAAGAVLWRTKIGTGGLTGGREIHFSTPLVSSANTLLEVVALTASVTGAIYVNAQGYAK